MIVDAHVHALPRGGRDSLAEVVRQCRVNGVSLGLVSIDGALSAYPDADEVRRSNDQAADFVARSSGLGRLLAYLNVQSPNWREELDRCLGAGAIGVKLWTSFKGGNGSLETG